MVTRNLHVATQPVRELNSTHAMFTERKCALQLFLKTRERPSTPILFVVSVVLFFFFS